MTRALRTLIITALMPLGCDADAAKCVEDIRAQVLSDRATLRIGPIDVDAEIAHTQTERERGWRYRRCDREALVMLSEPGTSVPIWGCDLVDPIDVIYVRANEVLEVFADVAPCPACDASCPQVGADLLVDAVIEVPSGTLHVEPGQLVTDIPTR